MVGGELFEREREIAALDQAMADARAGRGRLVVLEGEPGIGKSRLLGALTGHAVAAEAALLAARAGELDHDLPFELARRVFVGTARRVAGEPAGAARGALSVLNAEPVDEPAALHGLYWLLSDVAQDGPVVLALDDAHWADPESLRFLRFLVPRLADLPVLVVVATRPPAAAGANEELEELLDLPGIERIAPRALSPAAVARLVRAALPEAGAGFCDACARASGGNPFLLGELLLDLREDGVAPDEYAARLVAQATPRGVVRATAVRLRRMPDDARAVARALAILDNRADVGLLAELAGIDGLRTLAAIEHLQGAGILSPATPPQFAHPMLRTSTEKSLSAAERAQLHAAAARLLRRRGAAPERLAPHLVRTAPGEDQALVADLLAAAPRSGQAAMGYLQRALEEPPDGRLRPSVLAALGRAEVHAGEPGGLERLASALPALTDAVTRAQSLRETGHALSLQGRFAEAADAFGRAADAVRGVDDELEITIVADLVALGQMDFLPRTAVAGHMQRLPLRREPRTPGERAALAVHVHRLAAERHDFEDVAGLSAKALADESLAPSPPFYLAVVASVAAGGIATALERLKIAERAGLERGDLYAGAGCRTFRAFANLAAGDLRAAEADAQMSMRLNTTLMMPMISTFASAILVATALETGRTQEALEIWRRSGLLDAPVANLRFSSICLARGALRASQGDLRGGLDDVLYSGAISEQAGNRNPAMAPWRSTAALLHAGLGEFAPAAGLADEEVALAREFGAPAALGSALRVAAMLTPAQEREPVWREAVAQLEGSEAVLALGHALAGLGGHLLETGRPTVAREPLRRALDAAHRCGATVLAEGSRQLLVAAGGRPRRPALSGVDALSAAELRVATLAREGMTNRQIAEASFVTLKTVEVQLASVYRKLGIAGRRELSVLLGEG